MSSGKEAKAAMARASIWGDAVAVADGDAFLITNESITRTLEHLPDDSAGQAFHGDRDTGLITCGGDLGAYMRYQGLELLLALAMGIAGAPTQQESTSAYLHSLSLADETDGLFGTLCLYKGAGAHEYAGAKVDGFTISGEAGQPLSASFTLACDDLTINTTSGTNPAAALAALATPALGNRVLFRHGEFRLNDASAGALGAGDAIHPNRFNLSFRRNLQGDHLAGGEDKIAEPTAAGFPEVGLTLEFPQYTHDTFLRDLGSDTRKKASLVFTGGVIEGAYSYRLEILFPHLVLTNAEASVDRAGKIAHPLTLSCLAAAEAPAGMTGVTQPFALSLINTKDSDPLA